MKQSDWQETEQILAAVANAGRTVERTGCFRPVEVSGGGYALLWGLSAKDIDAILDTMEATVRRDRNIVWAWL